MIVTIQFDGRGVTASTSMKSDDFDLLIRLATDRLSRDGASELIGKGSAFPVNDLRAFFQHISQLDAMNRRKRAEGGGA